MNRLNEKKYLLSLFFISVVSFFSNICVRTADLMEARNFITAREMVKSGNYIVTTLNGNLRFEKPPLPTWLVAMMMKITNNFTDEWIFRIPVAIVGVISVFFIYYLVKYLTKNMVLSFLVGFVYSTTFMIIKVGNESTWDFYTYAFALGMITFLVKGMEGEKIKDFIISGVFLSGSILSKGPVGIYGLFIPFLMAHIYIFGIEKYRKNWKKIIILLLIGIGLSSLWPVIIYLKYHNIFLEVLKKEESTWMNSHKKSIFYYLDYFIYSGIWIFFTISIYIKNWNEKISDNKKYAKFIFLWNILVLIGISVIKMKKKRYGIPLFITSSLGVGNICYYFYTTTIERLNKKEKLLINIQKIFIEIILVGSIGFCIALFLKEKISIIYFLVMSILYLSLLVNFILKLKKADITKEIVIWSGLIFLIINTTLNGLINKNLIEKHSCGNEYKDLRILHYNPPKEEIYSKNFGIEDVWRIGKKINIYKEGIELPKNIVFFSDLPKEIKEKYLVLKKEKYINEVNEIVEIYFLEKRGD